MTKCKEHVMRNSWPDECLVCGKTRAKIEEEKNKKWIKAMEEDVPRVNSKSIREREKEDGHGFWGNATTGYIYEDLKRWP